MAMKWFRKHSKKILVVGGALLMVAFLLPRQDGCRGRRRGKNYPIAKAFGQNIMRSQLNGARIELELLARMGLDLQRQWQIRPIDYLLLQREAQKMRLPAGSEAVIEAMATEIAGNHKVADLAQLARLLAPQYQRSGIDVDEKLLRQALGNFISVNRTQELILGNPGQKASQDGQKIPDYSSALGLGQPSEKELELAFRNIAEQLDVEYIAFPAWRYASKVANPTDSEILAQFEAYKDKYPGDASNEFGFGYKPPLRLKLEYLKISLEEVKSQLQRPSPATVRNYYDKHKQLYVLPLEKDPSAPDEPDPDAPPPPVQYKPFEQVYEDCERRWLSEHARAKAVVIIGEARRLTRTRWEQLKKEQKDTPIAAENLYPYSGEQQETLVNLLREKFKISANYNHTGWIDIDQAEALPGIGVSYSRAQPILGFPGIASKVRPPSSEIQDSRDLSFELGQDYPINLQDAQHNLYLFRVIDLRRDQIRDASQILNDPQLVRRITNDLIAKRTYEYALDQARKLLTLAQKQGLKEALSDFADKKLRIRQAGMISRADSNKAQQELLIPLVDSAGKTHGQVQMRLQVLQFPGPQGSQPMPTGFLQIELTNTSGKGRITALGLGLPPYLRMYSRSLQPLGAPAAALNGGEPVPAGPEGYTVKYFAGAIDAGKAGKFDLLISNQSQQLTDSPNLSEGGPEPDQSQTFLFQLPSGLPARLIDFLRGPHASSGDMRAADSTMVARLETGRKTQLLRGIFPANRQNRFLRDCFSVLDSSTLLRKPAPPPQPEPKTTKDDQGPPDTNDKPTPTATPRIPDLLTEPLSGQAPCTLIKSPRGRRCYVISASKHLPLSRAQFSRSRPFLLNSLARDNHTRLMRDWLNSDSIRSRTRYSDLEDPQDAPKKDSP